MRNNYKSMYIFVFSLIYRLVRKYRKHIFGIYSKCLCSIIYVDSRQITLYLYISSITDCTESLQENIDAIN